MSLDPKDPKTKKIFQYFAKKKILVVDPVSTIRVAFRTLLFEYGSDKDNVVVMESIKQAYNYIQSDRPHYVFCNYKVKDEYALQLLPKHLEIYPNRLDSGFYLISNENSIAVASMVLDYEIDGYFIQPFTIQSLQDTFMKSVDQKVFPSNYVNMINEGKIMLFQKDYESAALAFDEAKRCGTNPALACFYEAVALRALGYHLRMEAAFKEGLSYNLNDYRCLNGLYEYYNKIGKFDLAYEIMYRVVQLHPVHPEKIPNLVKLSILNKKYEDIINYCDIFADNQDLSPVSKQYIAAGLAVCAKSLFSTGDRARGEKAIRAAGKLSNGKREILRNLAGTLITAGEEEKAINFLREFSGEEIGEIEFKIWDLEIMHETSNDAQKVWERGNALIAQGIANSSVYLITLENGSKVGVKPEKLESLAYQAVARFPDYKMLFNRYIEK